MNDWIESLPADKVQAWIGKYGEPAMKAHHTDDPHFALWLHYLDRACRRRVLMSYRDLEDWDYWSAYDAGMSPVEACGDMLDANGYSDAYEEAL